MKGMGISPGFSVDLSRLRVEMKALGGILDALFHAVQQGRLVDPKGGPTSTVPDEHLVSYA